MRNFCRFAVPALLCALLILAITSCADDDPATPADPQPGAVGTILIVISPDTLGMVWSCALDSGDTVTGLADSTLTNRPAGIYTVTWQEHPTRISPDPETRTLAEGDTLVFAGIYGPEVPVPAADGWTLDVLGNAADDVWAVGTEGALLHFDGDAWSRGDAGTSRTLRALGRDPDGTLWAGGDGGELRRLEGGVWTAVDRDQAETILALGTYHGVFHAGYLRRPLRRYVAGVWEDAGAQCVIRDEFSGWPVDTLDAGESLFAITAIDETVIGGAYLPSEYHGETTGSNGTQAMVLEEDDEFDWRIVPLDGSSIAIVNWVMDAISIPGDPTGAWAVSDGGELFLRQEESDPDPGWSQHDGLLTADPAEGANGLWRADSGDLYIVTTEGSVVYVPAGGAPETIHGDPDGTLMSSIWGIGPDDLWISGLWDHRILHLDHDPGTGEVQTQLWEFPRPDAKNAGR